jgi:hypothetical protein
MGIEPTGKALPELENKRLVRTLMPSVVSV